MLTYLLTAIFAFMMLYSIIFVRRLLARAAMIIFYLAGIFFLWKPDETNVIANWFGIGRGLDLFIVCFSVAVIHALLFIVRHIHHQHKSLTRLTRHMAISEAMSVRSERAATRPEKNQE